MFIPVSGSGLSIFFIPDLDTGSDCIILGLRQDFCQICKIANLKKTYCLELFHNIFSSGHLTQKL
jgi:hypothetical protein